MGEAKLFLRYMTLQIPGMFVAALVVTLLVRWGQISETLAMVLFGFWVVKDLAMYPVMRVGYMSGGGKHGAEAMIGALGVAEDGLEPGVMGYVRVGPELWRAQLRTGEEEPVKPGDAVRVVEVRELTLRVERAGQ